VTASAPCARPLPRVREEALALAALAFLLGVTAVWWAVALWPVPSDAPAWLQTARAVCFGAHDDGLPGAGGWILLIGEPIGMVAALWLLAREPLGAGLRGLARSRAGRGTLAVAAALVVVGAGAAGWRVFGGGGAPHPAAIPSALRPLDSPAPALGLVDQHGDVVELERFRGRPVLVTFAFAQCETVCPLLVYDALRVAEERGAGVVVVTLDPWRDTPSRLPHVARAWGLGADAFVASGEVARVEAVLAAWGAAGVRDLRTGEVAHPPLTYVVDREGRLAFATTGTLPELREALDRL
jgi:cytochrome oxidase Cu insertion factor (SCO1/SenC/PrrC family)